MKRLNLFLLLICMFFCSCSSLSYLSTIKSSTQGVEQGEIGEFIVDNDSLQIIYNFNGINAPIHVEVYNKLSKPLYVDWNRSAIVINGTATNYIGKTTKIYGRATGSTYGTENYSWGRANFVGNVDLAVPISIIPPKSRIKETHLSLKVKFQNIDTKQFTRTKIGLSGGSEYARAEQASFSENDMPFAFQSFLTLQYEGEGYFHYDNDFYVEKLIILKDRVGYGELPNNIKNRADYFYMNE